MSIDVDWKREVLTLLFLQKGVIGGTALIVFAAAVLVVWLCPPTYQSSASVLMQPPVGAAIDTALRVERITKEDLASELEILVSRALIEKTVERLNQEKGFPAEAKSAGKDLTGRIRATLYNRLHALLRDDASALPPHVRQARWLQDRLTVQILPSTHVLNLHFDAGDPADAERVLGAHLQEYIPFRLQLAAAGDESKPDLVLERMQRDLGLARSEYEKYRSMLDQTKIETALARAKQQTGISVLDGPAYSGRRVFPHPPLVLIFGILAGLAAGCGLGFLRGFLDRRIHRREDVLRIIDLPVVLEIPSGRLRGK